MQNRFDIPGTVSFGPGRGELEVMTVTTPLSRAQIYLHGGQVTEFQPAGEQPVLWLSDQSVFHPAKAIRGGVPVCFPWFGAKAGDASAPAHGFARLAEWSVEAIRHDAKGIVTVVLGLMAGVATLPAWPHAFSARQTISVGTDLAVRLEITNTSLETIWFEEALHTYLAVSDVRRVSVEGLGGVRYCDKLAGGLEMVQEEALLRFGGETDRVYMTAPEVCVLNDPGLGRRIEVRSHGSRDTVVWNPWIEKARRMADFGDDAWPGMVCIETANIDASGQGRAVELAAGCVHTMGVTLGVVR